MKKFLLISFGVLAALPGMAQTFSYEYEGNTLNYEILNEAAKTCQVVGGNTIMGDGNLIIPSVAKDADTEYKVVSLGDRSFLSCTSLTSVTIPESVTTIGDYCFAASSLAKVTIPESVTSIGEYGFECCPLTSVTIPGSVTEIGDWAFYMCESLSTVTLSEGISSLGNYCFSHTIIEEIVLPESLRNIGIDCFYTYDGNTMNSTLTSVKFGSNIEHIGKNAFQNISQFEINDKLKSLGDRAFGDNLHLLRVTTTTPPQLDSPFMGYTEDEAYNILVIVPANGDDVYKNDPKWADFHIVEAAPTKTVYMTGRYSLAEEITTTTQQMPGNVTSLAIVGPLADDDWNIIKRNLLSCYDLDLSGVTNTEIPADVFRDNKHILSLKLPAGLKTIGNNAFDGCNNLTIDRLPDSVESIGDGAFRSCTLFDVDALPSSLKTIGYEGFLGCSRLQLTELPAVESIGEGAFYNCTRFMQLDMSATKLSVISENTFFGCSKLRNVILPETLYSIGNGAFSETAINFMVFPESLREIGISAFYSTPLISVELPRRFNKIEETAFSECSKLSSVSLPSGMESIGNAAFSNCRGIKSISVPCAVPPTVGNDAFRNVRYRDVMVSIPTMNYRDYLNALGWGSFTQLSNSIFLDYEEVDENGNTISEEEAAKDGVEVGAVENGAYDEIMDNIISEEEQAAEDAARDEALYGDNTEASAEIEARVRRARAAARYKATATADAKARKAFSRLYPGQSMTIGDNTGYRVKIEPKEGVEIVKIEFGGKDITDTYIDGMVTLPALYSKSNLKVYRKGSYNGIDELSDATPATTADVYNMQGILVLKDASEALVRSLAPGIYIYKGRKIIIR